MFSVLRLVFAHWLQHHKPVYLGSRFPPCPPLPRYLRVNYILGQKGRIKTLMQPKKIQQNNPKPQEAWSKNRDIFKMHVTLSKHFWNLFCTTVPLAWMAVASLLCTLWLLKPMKHSGRVCIQQTGTASLCLKDSPLDNMLLDYLMNEYKLLSSWWSKEQCAFVFHRLLIG